MFFKILYFKYHFLRKLDFNLKMNRLLEIYETSITKRFKTLFHSAKTSRKRVIKWYFVEINIRRCIWMRLNKVEIGLKNIDRDGNFVFVNYLGLIFQDYFIFEKDN